MAKRKLIVEVLGDTKSLDRALGKSSKSIAMFGKQVDVSSGKLDKTIGRFKGVGVAGGVAALAGGAAAAAALNQMNEAINVASNLNEQIGKSRIVFGDASADIEAFGRTAAKSIGIANDQAVAAAATFGSLFANTGQTQQNAAEMSRTIVTLAADLGAFSNLPVQDALDALRSGLSGEIEPLRRFQVFLTEAAVQQEALAETGKKSASQLTQGEKILARYNLILRQTKTAQGNFASTSENLAQKQKTLDAQTRDLQANIGKLALPIKTALISALVDATDAALELTNALGKLGNIKIPAIKIPFAPDIPGGKFGSIVKSVIGLTNPITGPLARMKVLIDLLPGDSSSFTEAVKKAIADATGVTPTGTAGTRSTFDPAAAAAAVQKGSLILSPSEKASLAAVVASGTEGLDDDLAAAQKQLDAATRKVKSFAGKGKKFHDAWVQAVKDQAAAQNEVNRITRQIADESARSAADAAATAKQNQRDWFSNLLDMLDFGRERADVTPTLKDDIAADRKIVAAIQQQIKIEGATVPLLRKLFQTRQDIANLQKEQRRRAASARQATQFRALGLTPEGDQSTPTIANLKKRRQQLIANLKAAGIDDPKVLAQLKRAGDVLAGKFGKVGEQVRAAIDAMFDKIGESLTGGGKKKGPLTKFAVVGVDKLIENLGLTPEQVRALRARLSGVGAGGTISSGGVGAFGRPVAGGQQAGVVAAQGGIVITGPITVISDDPDKFQRQLQRKARRRGTQTTGPHAGNAMGTTR